MLVSEAQAAATAPFPHVADVDVRAAFAGHENAVCDTGRLSLELLRAELAPLPKPLRIVVSGPAGYNGAAKSMLQELGVEAEAITILSA